MSNQLDVFVVDEGAFKAALAKRDLSVFKAIADKPGAQGPDFGAVMSKFDFLLMLLGNPPARRALKKIVLGKTEARLDPPHYFCAYYMMCEHFSSAMFQDWNHFPRMAHWLGNIDEALQRTGLNIGILLLAFGPTKLIDMKRTDPDEVCSGYWNREDIAMYKAEIEKYFSSDYFETDDDPFKALGYPLHSVYKWLERASAQQDAVLVGFYF